MERTPLSNPSIIKKLYKVTQDQPEFTVEDMRTHGIHKDFRHKNQIGSFFRWMSSVGYTEATGTRRATHEAANKRWVFGWRWTDKAHQEFGDKRPNGQQRLFQ